MQRARDLINEQTPRFSDWLKVYAFEIYGGRAKFNSWYTVQNDEYSFALLCSGIQIRQPQFSVEDGKFKLKSQIVKDPFRVDRFCDSYEEVDELDNLHPQNIYDKFKTSEPDTLMNAYKRANDSINPHNIYPAFFYNKFLRQYTY